MKDGLGKTFYNRKVNMVPIDNSTKFLDPVETLNLLVEEIWSKLCSIYDVIAAVPDVQTIFRRVDLDCPEEAAQIILANMLIEIIERISRFSPWYTKPARAFGLVSFRQPLGAHAEWFLAPEAAQKYRDYWYPAAQVISQNRAMIKAALLIDRFMEQIPADEPYVMVTCACAPQRKIRVKESIRDSVSLICDECNQPFV
jgi:hypothetical protein